MKSNKMNLSDAQRQFQIRRKCQDTICEFEQDCAKQEKETFTRKKH